jgi:hypothetical protein
MNTDAVNDPAGYLERRQRRIDNITILTAAFLTNRQCSGLTEQQIVHIVRKAEEVYEIIESGHDAK